MTREEQTPATELYLSLLKDCLLNRIYGDSELIECNWQRPINRVFASIPDDRVRHTKLLKHCPMDEYAREVGGGWPPTAHTMIGMKRLNNLQWCVEETLKNNVAGDFIETGVWRGGACILMRAILKAYRITDRKVFVADSFEGLPKPDPRYPADKYDQHYRHSHVLGVSKEQVMKNFEKYGLLDDQVIFLKGWFKDSLPTAPIKRLAVLRIDGDMYESTMDALKNLYPKVSEGGYCIVDDYGALPNCMQAVEDYRIEHGITNPITRIDYSGIFWKV